VIDEILLTCFKHGRMNRTLVMKVNIGMKEYRSIG
jgi:hypothetical protein